MAIASTSRTSWKEQPDLALMRDGLLYRVLKDLLENHRDLVIVQKSSTKEIVIKDGAFRDLSRGASLEEALRRLY